MKSMVVGDDLIFVVEHRGGDGGGPSLHLLVRLPADPPRRETRQFVQVWRADCFKKNPHQHWFGPEHEQIQLLEPSDAAQPIEWCLSQLENILTIVMQAGYSEAPAGVSQPLSPDVLPKLWQWMLRE